MRDGAPAHFIPSVGNVLSNTYRDRWIGRGGPIAWSPHSRPDLNPLDFYLCGCLSDYPQLPWQLRTDAAVHVETCRGVH
jgi:hypothetical protein